MKQKTELYYNESGDLLELFVGKPTASYYNEMERGIFIGRDEKTDEVVGFKLFSFKRRLEKNLNLSYDKIKDVLKIFLGKQEESYTKELSDKVFIHVDKKTSKVKGFTILDFRKRLIKLNFHDLPIEEPPLIL